MDDALTFKVLGFVVTLLFGGVVSACLGASLSHMLTQRRSYREYQLKKLEELAAHVQSYSRLVEIAFKQYLHPHWAEVTLPSIIHERENKLREAESHKLAMEILIKFYFVNLICAFNNLLSPVGTLLKVASQMDQEPGWWHPAPNRFIRLEHVETPYAEIAKYERELHNRIIETAMAIKADLVLWPFGSS